MQNYRINKLEVAHDTNLVYKTMTTKRIFLVKMYMKFNDDKESKSWRDKATPIWACETFEEAKEDVLRQIKKDGQSKLYKKLYYIQGIELFKKVVV